MLGFVTVVKYGGTWLSGWIELIRVVFFLLETRNGGNVEL
jgi:hypothetical protein